ncbi:hypothetical protein CQA53_03705 [Helicobacter didelphidarum]|uniref:RNB domain-containing protein n=1 Tax=Helicobacter didelphidarum TaxID=2040648 RepID=A0A3D8IPL7_9HELI|nr:RNB domain-containing ribonuclease [Helicobacter didelphidarum]RDU66551.1 hypothetical protein CQA53_03705 [Helicobacter didelphidarum]
MGKNNKSLDLYSEDFYFIDKKQYTTKKKYKKQNKGFPTPLMQLEDEKNFHKNHKSKKKENKKQKTSPQHLIKINQYNLEHKRKNKSKNSDKTLETILGIVTQDSKKRFIVLHFKYRTILPIQVSQKALQALPRLALLVLNAKFKIIEVLGSLLDFTHDKKIAMLVHNYKPKEFSEKSLLQAENMATGLQNLVGVPFLDIEKIKRKQTKQRILYKDIDSISQRIFEYSNTSSSINTSQNLINSLDINKTTSYVRFDLKHLPFCTIDPTNAKDHDDALYYDDKRGILYVAIADVSEYVIPQSILDKEALQRAFSLYFPNQVFPMLPKILSANACSLRPMQSRLAIVWEMRLHKQTGNILRARVFKAIIESKMNLSYQQADKILEYCIQAYKNHSQHKKLPNIQKIPRNSPLGFLKVTGASDSLIQSVIQSLFSFYRITQYIYRKRTKIGFDLCLKDFNIALNADSSIKKITLKSKTLSHIIIEEAMLLANQESARLLERIQHGIFRNHKSMNMHNFKQLAKTLGNMGYEIPIIGRKKYKNKQKNMTNREDTIATALHILQQQARKQDSKNLLSTCNQQEIVDTLIVKCFQKATYKHRNLGHFGLGFRTYTHFTSPIRRYADLMVHRFISAYLKNDRKMLSFLSVQSVSAIQHINAVELQFDSIESLYRKLCILRYFEKFLPQKQKVFILEIKQNEILAMPLDSIGYCMVKIVKEDSEVANNQTQKTQKKSKVKKQRKKHKDYSEIEYLESSNTTRDSIHTFLRDNVNPQEMNSSIESSIQKLNTQNTACTLVDSPLIKPMLANDHISSTPNDLMLYHIVWVEIFEVDFSSLCFKARVIEES